MDLMAGVDVAILGAVPEEIGVLTELLETCQAFPFRSQTIWLGKLADLSVLLGTTGLGKVNAAITAASLLERFSIAQVWNVGCAGAYSDGPLKVGDVLVTEKVFCGDEGVMTEHGVLPVSEIGIPILVHHGVALFDHLPPHWEGSLEAIIKQTPPGTYRHKRGFPLSGSSSPRREPDEDLFQLVHGPSLTVSMASGDPQVASERFRRYGAYAENMEGSAVAQACYRFDAPVAECRGISNIAGIRTKESWQLEKSIAHCHDIVIRWLDALKVLKSLK